MVRVSVRIRVRISVWVSFRDFDLLSIFLYGHSHSCSGISNPAVVLRLQYARKNDRAVTACCCFRSDTGMIGIAVYQT